MKVFLIPHAHTDYTSQCLLPILGKTIQNYTRIIYVSTLHNYNQNIIYSNTPKIGNNLFNNDVQLYTLLQANGLPMLLNNAIEQSEHSLVFNIPFLKRLYDDSKSVTGNAILLSVFYMHSNVNRYYFFKFIELLNGINTLYPNTLYLFNSDFSHLNLSNNASRLSTNDENTKLRNETNIEQFAYIDDELNYREMDWIKYLLYTKNIPYEHIENFVGCGGAVVVMLTWLNFIGNGVLLCKSDNQTKLNYLNMSNNNKISNNYDKIVSYVSIGYHDNKIYNNVNNDHTDKNSNNNGSIRYSQTPKQQLNKRNNTFRVVPIKNKQSTYYQIYKIKEKKFVPCIFKTKQSATNQMNNWLLFKQKIRCNSK